MKNIVADPEYLDITLAPDAEFIHPVRSSYTAAAYPIAGEGMCGGDDDRRIRNRDLISLARGTKSGLPHRRTGCGFFFFLGKPFGEPVARRGPIVMNTQDELRQAFREYLEGTFIKKKAGV